MQPVLKKGLTSFKEYDIEFIKLSNGSHSYSYEIGKDFFELYGNDLLSNGDIKVNLTLLKSETFFELDFVQDGAIALTCDRCLDPLNYPVKGELKVVVKVGVEQEDEDENVLYISPEAHSINVAQTIYELISLSLPLVRYCEDANKECNEEMISKINGNGEESPNEVDPRWNKLKDLYKN